METWNQKRTVQLLFAILLVIAISGCSQFAGDPNFTLAKDDSISGALLVFSQRLGRNGHPPLK